MIIHSPTSKINNTKPLSNMMHEANQYIMEGYNLSMLPPNWPREGDGDEIGRTQRMMDGNAFTALQA